MLNIVKTKQKGYYPFLNKYKRQNLPLEDKINKSNNIIYYPTSTKE